MPDLLGLPENFIFAPVEDFSWGRIGHYVVGNTYNCSSDARHDPLREKCAEWLAAGLIEIMPVGGFIITTYEVPVEAPTPQETEPAPDPAPDPAPEPEPEPDPQPET